MRRPRISGGNPAMTNDQAKRTLKEVKRGGTVPAEHLSDAKHTAAKHYRAQVAESKKRC